MSTSVFHEFGFTVEHGGQEAIDALKQFAPRNIRKKLQAQVVNLDTILKTGKMPILGRTGAYKWMLAVWNIPAPLRVCLIAWRFDGKLMTISEGLQIEQEATKKASSAVRRIVSAMPSGVSDEKLQNDMWHNIRRGFHWSRGLS